MKNALLMPPWLQPGDRVCVVAPSGAIKEPTALRHGIEIWRSRGYQVEEGVNYQAQYGYLAGTDAQRRASLAQAWNSPDYKAILCARGGYGSTRLLEDWQWPAITPKWLVGFSDVTGLLWSLAKTGISGLHAPVLTTLAQEPTHSIDRLFAALEGRPLDPLQGTGWGKGSAIAPLLPANLTVATQLLQTAHQPALSPVILALEDVTEAPYRIDRLLTHWRQSNALQSVKGIALGRFSRCDPPSGSQSWSIEEVLRDRLADLAVPIVSDLAFGHDGENAALPVGSWVRLDGDQGTLTWLDSSA
jgi:muramoyltetrapeptide carboxypeptidase